MLRVVDDRGVGETTGNVLEATSADIAQDVLVGVNYLKGYKGRTAGSQQRKS